MANFKLESYVWAASYRTTSATKNDQCMARGGGLVVRVLALYSDDQSSNPAGVYSFYS